MGGMEACIDVRREIRVLAWVAGAEVLLAVMFQFYPHGPQLGTDPFNLGYLFGRWMCAVEAVALVRQVGHMDRLAKKLSGLDGYLLTEQLRAVERVRRDGAICLRAAVFGLYPLVFLGIEFLAFHSLRSLTGYLLSLGFYLCYEAAQLRFRRKLRGLMNALEGGGF